MTTDDLMAAADWDAIRAIDEPRFVSAEELPADFISADQRVIGLRIDGESIAIPHGEIWAQKSASSLCEDPRVERLPQWPVIEVRWETWRALHPNTLVLDAPHGAAGSTASRSASARGQLSAAPSRSERVIGAPSAVGEPGIAFSFDRLVDLSGTRQVIAFTYEDESFRLLWSDEAMGGMAYSPRTESGHEVDLVPVEGDPSEEGGFRDRNTGSFFTLDGRGVAGSLAGEELVPLVEAYVAYRGPWLDFHPDSRMWGG